MKTVPEKKQILTQQKTDNKIDTKRKLSKFGQAMQKFSGSGMVKIVSMKAVMK